MRWRLAALAMSLVPFMTGAGAGAGEVQTVLPIGLHATFILPEGNGAVPAALILPGSGPVNRDGNVPGARNDSLRLLAEGLAARGIATLRADKRGIGESRGAGLREEDLHFETYVDDAVAWLDWLDGQERVGGLFLIGHSEGALVATLAARKRQVGGLVLLAGAGFPAGEVIERQLAGAPASLREASKRIVRALETGDPAGDVPVELAPLYRKSVQPYLRSWLPLDPAQALGAVAAPVLLVQGTRDIQIRLADFQRLHAAKPDAEELVIEGMNHVLKIAPPDVAANLATYDNPLLPLAPSILPAVSAFIFARYVP